MDEPAAYTGPRLFAPKTCTKCGKQFTPAGANTQRCRECCLGRCIVCGETWYDPHGTHPSINRPRKYCRKPECKEIARTGAATKSVTTPPSKPPEPALDPPLTTPSSPPPSSVLERLLKVLHKHPTSTDQLGAAAGISPADVKALLLGAQAEGHNVICFGDEWSVAATPQLGGASAPYMSRPDGSYVFGFCGDTHLGSKYARPDVLHDLYRRFKALEVDRVFHTGNWIDGEANFNRYDLLVHGMDGQVRYLVENYPQAEGLTTYAVTGDDHEGWYGQKSGVDIGKYADNAFRDAGRKDWVNLGYMEAYVPLQHAVTGATAQLHVMHPGGGSAYAVSYTIQKIAEGYGEGEKPAVLLAGHYHKGEFVNVRGIWCVQTCCCSDQTPFLRKKKIHVTIGGGVMRLVQNPETGAIEQAGVDFFLYFNRGYYENQRWSMSGPVVQPRRV